MLLTCKGELVVVCEESIFFSPWTRLSLRRCITKCKTIIFYQDSTNDEYCIIRECENFLRGYLYDGDLVFVILKGISIFKFPKRNLEISARDLTPFLLQLM
jgi:hypothetical protein